MSIYTMATFRANWGRQPAGGRSGPAEPGLASGELRVASYGLASGQGAGRGCELRVACDRPTLPAVGQRYGETEAAAFARLAVHLYPAAVGLHKTFGDGEAQSFAAG
jgi:hypothetical protein